MTLPEMPELPPPYRKQGQQISSDGCVIVHCDLFSIEQMQAYGEACARVERERAARVCEAICASNDESDGWDSGYRVAAGACAAAIRGEPK